MKEITLVAILGVLISLGAYKIFTMRTNETLVTSSDNTISYGDITKSQANKLLQDDNSIILLDVRTIEEHQEKSIPNSVLIPVDELKNRLDELDKSKTYIIYCRSGNRSRSAFSIMKNNGYEKLYNLLGGINEYYR